MHDNLALRGMAVESPPRHLTSLLLAPRSTTSITPLIYGLCCLLLNWGGLGEAFYASFDRGVVGRMWDGAVETCATCPVFQKRASRKRLMHGGLRMNDVEE